MKDSLQHLRNMGEIFHEAARLYERLTILSLILVGVVFVSLLVRW